MAKKTTTVIEDDEEEAIEPQGKKYTKRETEIDIKGLPGGLRAVLRSTPWRDKDFDAKIMRMVPNPLRHGAEKPRYVRTVPNQEVGPEYLQSEMGGGRYQVWYFVKTDKGDILLATDTFDVEGPLLNHQYANPPGSPGGNSVVPASPQGGAGDGGLAAGISNLTALASVVAMLRGDAIPGENGNGKLAPNMKAFYKERISKLDNKEKELDAMKIKLEAQIQKNNNGLPDVMKPFAPLIESISKKLAGSGATGAVPSLGLFKPLIEGAAKKLIAETEEATLLRAMLFQSPDFQTVWSVAESRANVSAAVVQLFPDFGPDLVKKLMAMTPNP